MVKKLQILLILSLIPMLGYGQEVYNATRILKSGDINTNPDWIWYNDNNVQLYVEANQPPINRRMPWFDNNGTAAIALNTGSNSTRDMYPSDGWVLIYRDFGSEEIEQKWPHFILYNSFKGILRLFFIDFFESTQKTLYAIKFYHKNSSITSANISSNSITKGYINSYDPSYSQIGICRATPGQWSYVDFDITTYDPNLPDNLGFAFEVNSILEGKLELFANKLEEVEDKTPTTFDAINSTIKKSAAGIALGKQYFSTPKGFLEDMKKHADNNIGKWFEKPLRSISTSSISNSIPIIGGVVGIITGFIGADKGVSSSFIPFTITGDIKFESPIADFFIWAPGSNRTETNGRGLPLYDKPLGIIGVKKIKVLETIHEDTYVNFRRSSFIVNNLEFVINPNSNLKVSTLEFGVIPESKEISYSMERDFVEKKHTNLPEKVAMRATINSVCNPEKEVFIVKSFSNFDIIKSYQPYPPFYNGPTPMFSNDYLNTNFNIFSEENFYIGGDRGGFISNNSKGEIKAPTSIILKSGTHIKGGNVKISLSYKAQHSNYMLSNNFECTDDLLDQTLLKSARVSSTSEFGGIRKSEPNSNVQIYPNPFENILYIKPIDFTSSSQIRIYKLNGTIVYNSFLKGISHIQTNYLSSGLYIIEIINNGDVIKREKIVKY